MRAKAATRRRQRHRRQRRPRSPQLRLRRRQLQRLDHENRQIIRPLKHPVARDPGQRIAVAGFIVQRRRRRNPAGIVHGERGGVGSSQRVAQRVAGILIRGRECRDHGSRRGAIQQHQRHAGGGKHRRLVEVAHLNRQADRIIQRPVARGQRQPVAAAALVIQQRARPDAPGVIHAELGGVGPGQRIDQRGAGVGVRGRKRRDHRLRRGVLIHHQRHAVVGKHRRLVDVAQLNRQPQTGSAAGPAVVGRQHREEAAAGFIIQRRPRRRRDAPAAIHAERAGVGLQRIAERVAVLVGCREGCDHRLRRGVFIHRQRQAGRDGKHRRVVGVGHVNRHVNGSGAGAVAGRHDDSVLRDALVVQHRAIGDCNLPACSDVKIIAAAAERVAQRIAFGVGGGHGLTDGGAGGAVFGHFAHRAAAGKRRRLVDADAAGGGR